MKKSHSLLIGFAILTLLASPYRVEIVGAAINAVKKLKIDLAAGNIPVVASSTDSGAVETAMLESGLQPSHVVKYSGKVTWSGSGATLKSAIMGTYSSSDLIVASISEIPTQAGYLAGADVFRNNSALWTLSAANTSNDAEVTYQVLRAAP